MTTSNLQLSRSLLVGEKVRRAAHQVPNKEAFIFGDVRCTYGQLEKKVVNLAGWMQQAGIGYEDKVGLLLLNGLPFVEVFYATALTGAVSVPLNFRLNSDELAFMIDHSDCRFLFVDHQYVELIESILYKCPKLERMIVVGDSSMPESLNYDSIFDHVYQYEPCTKLNGYSDCSIIFTSGTTGQPKGAMLTHQNLCINGMNRASFAHMDDSHKQLIVAPLFHIAALSTLVSPVNGTSIIHSQFQPVDVLEAIEKERINAIFLAPTMWHMLVSVPNINDYDLTSLKSCYAGSAQSPIPLKEKILKSFPNGKLYDPFGQSEMSPVTTCLLPEDSLRKNNSVGKPIANVEIRVVDEEMNDVPLGEIGEVVYRGPTLMKEYYKNPEATEEAFRGGWFHSGDLVRMDDEGFIYIVDRKKDMIISGGENIYPVEIENHLYEHPDIQECAVIGVPDELWGEVVKAIVVKKQEAELTEQDIIDFCQERLSSYKKPKIVEFVAALPRNAAGKILKKVLREIQNSN